MMVVVGIVSLQVDSLTYHLRQQVSDPVAIMLRCQSFAVAVGLGIVYMSRHKYRTARTFYPGPHFVVRVVRGASAVGLSTSRKSNAGAGRKSGLGLGGSCWVGHVNRSRC